MEAYRGLSFRTHGNISPKRRPRIYFCCDPQDFSTCFEPIVAAVLQERSDAAVWYYDPAAGIPAGEDFLTDLRQIQLFVFPVSSRFLNESSSAKNVELALALQEHIPILPLAIEKDALDLFDQKFGNVHALKFSLGAGSEVPAALGRHLREVFPNLPGEDAALNIFGSFDAYLFLSYRKWDRGIADQLIRMIRAKAPFDHTAVWFDEYLVPGEDYSEDIDTAIRQCSVFVLLATENLNEKGNYVIREEIPLAKQIGKPICVVLAGIRREDLPESLSGARICDLQDEDGVRRTLSEILAEIARAEQGLPLEKQRISSRLKEILLGQKLLLNESDAVASYCEGMACLKGILSQVDQKRAFERILLSAEMGLPVAMQQVARMYFLGQGTELNMSGALIWQEQYVDAIEDAEELSLQYYVGLEDLLRYQSIAIEAGTCSVQEKENTLFRLLDRAEMLEEQGVAPQNTLTVESKLFIGEYYQQLGDASADTWFLEAREALQEADGTEATEMTKALSAEVGAMYGGGFQQQNRKKGLELMQNALETLQEVENPLVIPFRFHLAVEISQALEERGKLREAKEIIRSALQDVREFEANEGVALDPELLYPMYLKYGIYCGPAPSEEAKEALLAARQIAETSPDQAKMAKKKPSLYFFMGLQQAFSPEERISFLRHSIMLTESLDFTERLLAQTAAKHELKKLEKEVKRRGESGVWKGLFRR